MELAENVFKKGYLPKEVEKEFHSDLINSLMSYAIILKGPQSFSQKEMTYISSININLQKLDGDLKLDTFCAIEELKDLTSKRSLGQIDEDTCLQKLKDIDSRVYKNSNSTTSNMFKKLPFGLKYLFDPKFMGLYTASMTYMIKSFVQMYYNITCQLVNQISQSKVSLAQVMFTDLYKEDRFALFSALADNKLIAKGLEIYNLQFGWGIEDTFLFMKNVGNILWKETTFEDRRQTLWRLFEINFEIKQTILDNLLPQGGITQTVSKGLSWGVGKLGSIANSILPSSMSQTASEIMSDAVQRLESSKEDLMRSAMQTARAGRIPKFDIQRIIASAEEFTYEGDYIENVLSKIIIILFVILLIYSIVSAYSWFDARRTKDVVLRGIGRYKFSFRHASKETKNLQKTRKIFQSFVESVGK